jgi:1,5-anhydro-D-fructose reductase (1,5-anhydro-D-mannitol-forming)
MKTVRWGILGCGDVTEVKSGPGFQKARGSELVAVMRRDGAKAADYARRHGVARWYDQADALIGDKDVDAVYIATPPGSHELYALQVLAAGKPCYVEKPMTRNASEARRMVEAFKGKGVPLFVAYYRRALPRFLEVKKILQCGELGKLVGASYCFRDGKGFNSAEPLPWRLCAEEAGGGLFLDMASHVLDLLDFWLGPLKLQAGRAKNVGGYYAVEDEIGAVFQAANGIPIDLECAFHTAPREACDKFVIMCEQGRLEMSCFGNEGLLVHHSAAGTDEHLPLPNPPHVAQPLIQTVVDDLLGLGKCASTGESGLRTQEVMDRVLEGYYGGREDGFWKRPWPGNKQG